MNQQTSIDSIQQKITCSILRVFLVVSTIATLISYYDYYLDKNHYEGLSPFTLLIVTLIILFLSRLACTKYYKYSSTVLVIVLMAVSAKIQLTFGVRVAPSQIIYAWIIIVTALTISLRYSIALAIIIATFNISITYLQLNNTLPFDNTWTQTAPTIPDGIINASLLLATVYTSWLYKKQIINYLSLAIEAKKKAETLSLSLQQEKDSLEQKVTQKTKQLQTAHYQKIQNLNKLADIGRLTTGIMHDISTPLTTISLILEDTHPNKKNISYSQQSIQKVLNNLQVMESYIRDTLSYATKDQTHTKFTINKEIETAIKLLKPQANYKNIRLIFKPQKNFTLTGDPNRFIQIITNLVSNAIESYSDTNQPNLVTITTQQIKTQLQITVKDKGKGISKINIKKIFVPFYSGSNGPNNHGIGLTLTKDIIEQNFNGQISLNSQKGKGSEFIVNIPLNKNDLH